MHVRSIAPESWTAELDAFSRQHEGWIVSITTRSPLGDVDVRDVPLQGVSRASHSANNIVVTVADARRHLTHDVHNVIALRFELTAEDAERALVLVAPDGSTTSVEFRSPARVEEVDGSPVRRSA